VYEKAPVKAGNRTKDLVDPVYSLYHSATPAANNNSLVV
jgi:hypothetical protein